MSGFDFYFAGNAWKSDVGLGITKRLFSFAYSKELGQWLSYTEGSPGKIMIDSGAFTVWNRGGSIDLDSYIEYCKESIERVESSGKLVRVVNLDVIPGVAGRTLDLLRLGRMEFEVSARKGFENLLCFVKAGVVPIHVFHQGEDFGWIDRMIEYTDYIGISPANDVPQGKKELWIGRVFDYLYRRGYENVKTHGFAVSSPGLMLKFPWTSCDSATWKIVAGYGKVIVPRGGFDNPDYSKGPVILDISDRSKRAHRLFREFQGSLLGEDSSFEELSRSFLGRVKLNVKYFLGLERYINSNRKCRQPSFVGRRRFFHV